MIQAAPITALVFAQAGWISRYGVPDTSGDADNPPTLLTNAQPFEYAANTVGGEAETLAASTNSPKFAAKMLGYDQNTFGEMLHRFKPDNLLRPNDNVIWHDNGDVYFNGEFIANFHDWNN